MLCSCGMSLGIGGRWRCEECYRGERETETETEREVTYLCIKLTPQQFPTATYITTCVQTYSVNTLPLSA